MVYNISKPIVYDYIVYTIRTLACELFEIKNAFNFSTLNSSIDRKDAFFKENELFFLEHVFTSS